MAILDAEARRKLQDSQFAIPSERKYPIHDKAHAENALARVSQFGSPAEKSQVRAAVAKKYPGMSHAKKSPHKKGSLNHMMSEM